MFGFYFGEHENKVDGKGRLSIPADFRRELEEGDPKFQPGGKAHLALVYGDERRNYIEVFSIANLVEVSRQIARLPRGSRKRAEMQKLYAHQVLVAQMDETGRIVLPGRLRDKLGVTDRALVVGNTETFLIYDPDTYAGGDMPGLAAEPGFDPALDPSVYLPGSDPGPAGPGDAT